MSELNDFNKRLGTNLREAMPDHTKDTPPEDVVGAFDFSLLLDALFGVLMDFLRNCLSNFNADDVTGQVQNLGPLQRWAIRRSIRKSDIPRSQRQASFTAAVKTLEESSPEQIKAGVNEFNAVTVDWGLE